MKLPVKIKLPKIFQTRKPQSPSLSSADSSRSPSASSSSSSDLSVAAQTPEVYTDNFSGLSNSRKMRGKDMASSSRSSSAASSSDLSVAVQTPEVYTDSSSGRSNSRKMRGKDMASSSTQRLSSINDSEYQELEDAFKIFDKNGDGKISTTELGEVLRSLGDNPSDEDLQLMVSEVDTDGDGQIDLDEFITLNQDAAGLTARSQELKAAFSVFDRDRNDYISAEELLQVLNGLGQPSLTIDDCCRMIKGVDSDGDGRVNFTEFETMMTSTFVF